jgi:hypothetical protein
MSFKSLKKKRTDIADLAAKLEKGGKKSYDSDDRYWYPKRDENGNGYAIIRFLPAPGEEASAYIQTFRHGFKVEGKGWYIEECPTTIGEKCPVCEANSQLYTDLGKEKASQIVSGQNGRKRKMQYIANIYVVSDPETPENEGKVFLFKFGAKIFDKIKLAVSPEFPDEKPVDPFDLWEGANFTLKIRKRDNQVNYDSSSFGESSQLLPTDKELEAVYNAEHSLEEIIAPDKFKSYDELKQKFNRVTGVDQDTGPVAEAPKSRRVVEEKSTPVEEPEESPAVNEDADTIDFFQSLVEDA